MANPALNDEALRKAAGRAGWAAPTTAAPGGPGTIWNPPISDGPVSPHRPDVMTTGGVATATGVLLVLLLAAGVFGWSSVTPNPVSPSIPGWVLVALLGGFGLAIANAFRPQWSRVLAPAYALCQGLVLGAISRVYELQYNGIVLQAAMLTSIVVGAMLFAYATRLIKVTERMRSIVTVATLGIMAFYGLSLLLSLFSVDMPFIWDAGPFGIAFSLFVVGLAAFNLLLDFDVAERAAAAGMPKYMEWYCAFGVMVTVVWLYLEILRLLSKLRER